MTECYCLGARREDCPVKQTRPELHEALERAVSALLADDGGEMVPPETVQECIVADLASDGATPPPSNDDTWQLAVRAKRIAGHKC